MATVTGLSEVRRALRRFPQQARDELKEGSERLAQDLARRIRSAANLRGPQTAKAGSTTRVVKGELPQIQAGGTRSKASKLVFGTEFGATRHFGWYRKARYFDSVGKQFPPHRGANSYWFFATAERNRAVINAESSLMAADLVRRWSA